MKTTGWYRTTFACAIGLFAVFSSGCVTDGGYGYSYDNSVDVGLDYYEPAGGYYGGWGPGYRVGPIRGGDDHHFDHGGGGRASPHAYRAPARGRSMPSIPSGARGGGGAHHR